MIIFSLAILLLISPNIIAMNYDWKFFLGGVFVLLILVYVIYINIKTYQANVMTFTLNKDTVQIGEERIKPNAIIELTPTIKVKENDSYKAGQAIEFDLTNEHKTQSLDWGNNYLLIKCGQFDYPLVLQQRK